MAILGLNEATATKDRLVTCTVTRDYFPQVCLAGRGATRGWRKGGQGSLAQGPKNWLLNGFKKEVASDLKDTRTRSSLQAMSMVATRVQG